MRIHRSVVHCSIHGATFRSLVLAVVLSWSVLGLCTQREQGGHRTADKLGSCSMLSSYGSLKRLKSRYAVRPDFARP